MLLIVDLYLREFKTYLMRVSVFMFIVLLLGCQKQPHSKEYIYTLKDDHLSLQERVDILRKSSSNNDDELLASIALLFAQNKNWRNTMIDNIDNKDKIDNIDKST